MLVFLLFVGIEETVKGKLTLHVSLQLIIDRS